MNTFPEADIVKRPPPVVLAVDDDERCLALIEAFLSPWGIRVETAANGEEAIPKAVQIQPDTILLDVMMPEMDGFETARRLKADSRVAHIPVLMVTALGGDVRDRVIALECGAADFLTKPVDRAELQARVRSLIQVKAYHDHIREHHTILEREVEQRTIALTREMETRRRLELAILDAEASERRRIGHELHDSLGQILTALAMVARGLELDLTDAGRPEAAKAATLSGFAEQAKQVARGLTEGLSVMFWDDLDLEHALRELANCVETVFGVDCRVVCDCSLKGISHKGRTQVSRIAGEAAFNAAKHAGARSITMSLQKEGDRLALRIHDDGIGMPAVPAGPGMGLAIMRHRAELIGAELRVESESGKGTTVICILGDDV